MTRYDDFYFLLLLSSPHFPTNKHFFRSNMPQERLNKEQNQLKTISLGKREMEKLWPLIWQNLLK